MPRDISMHSLTVKGNKSEEIMGAGGKIFTQNISKDKNPNFNSTSQTF